MVSDYNYAVSRVVWFLSLLSEWRKEGKNTVIQLISLSSPNHSLLVNDTFHMMHHIMVEVGADLWKSSGPTSLLTQGHLQEVAQDHIRIVSEYILRWRLYNPSGKLCQCWVSLPV